MACALPVALVAPRALAGQSHRPPATEPAPIQAGVAPAPGPYAPALDVLHYDIEVGLSDTASWFAGRTAVRLVARSAGGAVPLDLSGLAVDSVREARTRLYEASAPAHDAAQRVSAEYRAGVLRVPLPAATEVGDTVTVEVFYRGVPDDGLILRRNVHGAPAAFADNWPNRARFWFPSVDHPSDKATVRFTVHAPAAWSVVANGALVSGPAPTPPAALGPAGARRTWVYETDVDIPTYTMVVGAAHMVRHSVGLAACGHAPATHRPDGCVNVTWWAFPEDTASAARNFRRAADVVDFFTETVGPFPYEKLANVQSSTRFGGMENASAIFYSEQAIAAGRDIEGTVAHEIAHQWFGDSVTEADWHHLWLSEGFATYFGALYFEHAEGVADLRRRMEQSRLRYIRGKVTDRPIVDPAEHNLFALLNDNNYPKGGWVLHMLRGILGDDAFFRGIRAYYARHAYGNALTPDLRQAMEKASGRPLGWFFRQWVYAPGYPIFALDRKWTGAQREAGTLTLTVRQVQKDAWPRFRVPMEVEFVHRTPGSGAADERRERRHVEVSGAATALDFHLPARPDSVILDPDGWVLKDLAPGADRLAPSRRPSLELRIP